MRTFIAKNFKTGLKITFQYNLKGVLQVLEFDGDWRAEKVEKMKYIFPASLEKMLFELQNQKPGMTWIFVEVTEVNFDAFYRAYPRHVGRREQTEKMWNKLGKTDQLEAILYIEELKKLKSDGTAFPYPATYLNQKFWR